MKFNHLEVYTEIFFYQLGWGKMYTVFLPLIGNISGKITTFIIIFHWLK